jgi:hypothetical protein
VTVAALDVLAHQGGWDEALFVAVPMAVLVLLLAVAQRRAAAEHEADDTTTPPADPDER